ncbi:MAG: hypothetical protein FWH29_00245 [Methanobrevibacter sp.]|nr:hypothetical protein [Methanobrevibacter sp.]
MRLRNVIILVVALVVILMGSLIFSTSSNVSNLDDGSNNILNNLDNESNNNVDTSSNNNPDNNSNNNPNKPNNSPDSNVNKPNNNPNNKPNNNSDFKPNNSPNSNVNKPNNPNPKPNSSPNSNVNKPNNNLNNGINNKNAVNENNKTTTNANTNTNINTNIPKINSLKLGSNDKGLVELVGPIGNNSSNVKIAFIIGVHPLEFSVHNILYNSLIAKSDSLKYCYYIYKVNVTNNPKDYDIGRMNGQLLANKFAVPDVISKKYDLVVDVHSNQGTNGGNYKKTNFIFAPLNNNSSKVLADEIIAKIPPLVYYYPESQTSPSYVTIPILKSGTPTLIYETYMYESNETTKDYINKLITTIDNLKIK